MDVGCAGGYVCSKGLDECERVGDDTRWDGGVVASQCESQDFRRARRMFRNFSGTFLWRSKVQICFCVFVFLFFCLLCFLCFCIVCVLSERLG